MFDAFPQTVRIKKMKQETPLVRSYVFSYPFRAKPGQFVNVWLPGFAEKPMSVAFDDGKDYTLAIAAAGDMTKELSKIKIGGFLGVRGPFGTNYHWKRGQKIAMLAGGYGAAPLYFAASLAAKQNCKIDFYLGARTRNMLLFADRIKKFKKINLFTATDDGSSGRKGTNVALWQGKIKEGAKYDLVMTCGPELMMKAVSDIAWRRKIPAQISVERYMKCGFGMCGNCCVDDLGITTCQNGPVMPNKLVRKIKEFSVYRRDSVGKKRFF